MLKKVIQKRLNSPDAILSMILGLAVVVVLGATVVNGIRSFTAAQKQAEEEKQKQEQQEQQVALPTTHKVSEEETLWSISETYYKTGYNWVDISKANSLPNPDYIIVDQELTIPDVEPKIVEAGDLTPALSDVKPKHASYTVVEGDCLWNISVNEYETGYKWPDVAKTNNIPNPDLIYPGTILQLP